jgi:hypothetical protein
LGGIVLICAALTAFGALAYFYVVTPRQPKLDAATLCPVNGPQGVTVVLVDTTDDLPEPAQREVSGILDELIGTLPPHHKLDIRVLDIAALRSLSSFSKCNPGDGAGLSEWTANPVIARKRWIEAFQKPAADAVKHSLVAAKAANSPIMGAIQNIALDEFSASAVQGIPKTLIVISDMLEFTKDYSQYPSAGNLSYERYQRSPAFQKFRTDLHGAHVTIRYVYRASARIDTVRHVDFWRQWITDNRGVFDGAKRLQGAG